jgi:hypothetical protein
LGFSKKEIDGKVEEISILPRDPEFIDMPVQRAVQGYESAAGFCCSKWNLMY